ncbi:MAG: RNA polymerase sigma factor [Fimbriimonadaceae bacterium]
MQLTNCGLQTEDSAEHPCVAPTQWLNRSTGPGGQARFERLIERHRPLIKKLCSGYTLQREDAEDLEAMTVLAACRRFASYDPSRGAFGTWIGAILRNEAGDMRRRAARQPQCLPNDHETEQLLEGVAGTFVEPFPDGPCDAEFELAPLLKRAFELVKLQGLTCAEAGQVMGKTEGTVRTYVWKARQVMRGLCRAS